MNSLTPHSKIMNPSVYDTVGFMQKFAKEGSKDLDIRRLTEKICAKLEPGDYSSEILAVYYWVCANIRYIRDIDNVEFLKIARQTLQTRTGDCDDIATLLAAMLISCGNIVRFAIVDMSGIKGPQPNYSHVFCQAYIPSDHKWITVDPVAGKEAAEMHGRISAFEVFPFR
jgi:transglutaminase-like putative cysteine protease